MASKYATKKPVPDRFGRNYVRMWQALKGVAECPTLCPECRSTAEKALSANHDESRVLQAPSATGGSK